jgi:hypothetical protein
MLGFAAAVFQQLRMGGVNGPGTIAQVGCNDAMGRLFVCLGCSGGMFCVMEAVQDVY